MKQFYLLTIALSCCYILCAQQGNWYQLADFPGMARYASTGFEINGKGYLVAGYNPSALTQNDTWEYEPATDQWTQKADFPGGNRWYAAGFSIGSKAYYGTGSSTNDWWEYDPATDIWTQKNNFSFVPRVYAVSFSLGNKGYVGLGAQNGQNNNSYKDFWEYDPATDSWTQLPDFPGGQRNFAIAIVIGNKAYVGTGEYPNYTYHDDFWEFDPSTNQWSPKASFPGLPRAMPVSFSVGGYGYVGMGVTIPVSTFYFPDDMWRYDPASDQWQPVFSIPRPKLMEEISFTIGNAAYIATGHPYGSDVWKFSDEKLASGINEEAAENKIEIFPNPANSEINIHFISEKEELITIKIFDAVARVVMEENITASVGINKKQFDISELNSGIYFVEIISGNNIMRKKLVVK